MAEELAVVPAKELGGIKAIVPPDFSAVDRTIKREADYSSLEDRIKKAGGVAAPEQRLQVAKSLAEVQPETSVLKAIGQSLLGNPNARQIASQGRIKPVTVYDVNGNGILATYAENSDIPLEAIDVKTKQPLTYDEWVARKGGQFANYKDTFGAAASKIQVERRAADYENESAIATSKEAAATPLKELHGAQRKAYADLGGLAGLSDKELNELSSFSNASATHRQSIDSAYNTMKQAQSDSSKKDALKKSGQYEIALGILSAAGAVTKDKIESSGKSDLDQIYRNATSAQGLETAYNQNQKQAFESAWYKRLDGNGKKLIEDIFQRSKNIDYLTAESTKFGDLLIAPTPFNPEILKQASSGELQASIGEFNADVSKAFADWRKNQNFTADNMPSAGQLQAAFTRTPEYKELQSKYHTIADDIEARAKANIEKHSGSNIDTAPTIGRVGVSPEDSKAIKSSQVARQNGPADDKSKKQSSEDKVRSLAEAIAKSLAPKK